MTGFQMIDGLSVIIDVSAFFGFLFLISENGIQMVNAVAGGGIDDVFDTDDTFLYNCFRDRVTVKILHTEQLIYGVFHFGQVITQKQALTSGTSDRLHNGCGKTVLPAECESFF